MKPAAPQARAAVSRFAGLRWGALVALAIGVSGLVMAQAPATNAGSTKTAAPRVEAGPAWASLTVAQQQALGPLKPEWSSIDATRKQKWLEVAAQFSSMPGDDRNRIQQRMAEWVRMSPAERGRARMQYQEARRLSPGQLEERWQAYEALPSDQRQALAASAAQPSRKPATKPAVTATGKVVANNDPVVKRNTVRAAPTGGAPKPVGPTVVQSRPGATTSLVTSRPAPPLHQQVGMPKVNASAGFVDPETLLPRRGPQGAAAQTVAPSGRP
jgi:hypothetical protein